VLAFYRGRGSAGAVNADVNGFNAIEDCRLDERLRRGNEGEVVTIRRHPRRRAERRSMAGNRWRRGRAQAVGGGGWS
jgi:hypothetical protein